MKKSLYISLDKSFNIESVEANHTDCTAEWKGKLEKAIYQEGKLRLWRTTAPKDKTILPNSNPFEPGTQKPVFAGKTGYTHIKLSDKERVIAAESFTIGNLAGRIRLCIDDDFVSKSSSQHNEEQPAQVSSEETEF